MFREKTCSTARAVCKQNERKKKKHMRKHILSSLLVIFYQSVEGAVYYM